jgi:hypothetical protein
MKDLQKAWKGQREPKLFASQKNYKESSLLNLVESLGDKWRTTTKRKSKLAGPKTSGGVSSKFAVPAERDESTTVETSWMTDRTKGFQIDPENFAPDGSDSDFHHHDHSSEDDKVEGELSGGEGAMTKPTPQGAASSSPWGKEEAKHDKPAPAKPKKAAAHKKAHAVDLDAHTANTWDEEISSPTPMGDGQVKAIEPSVIGKKTRPKAKAKHHSKPSPSPAATDVDPWASDAEDTGHASPDSGHVHRGPNGHVSPSPKPKAKTKSHSKPLHPQSPATAEAEPWGSDAEETKDTRGHTPRQPQQHAERHSDHDTFSNGSPTPANGRKPKAHPKAHHKPKPKPKAHNTKETSGTVCVWDD